MATPNMASIERSLQNCSLNHQLATEGGAVPAAETLELNSEGMALPLHWEQCLDLKSGEIYYINWKTGMKATEDPRAAAAVDYSEEDSSWYDSEGSSSPCSSREQQWSGIKNQENCCDEEKSENNNTNVVVVAGCKACLMYYMVPKHLQTCPKCSAQLLHLDPSHNASS